MNNQIQKTESHQALQTLISRETWFSEWGTLPVKAEQAQHEVLRLATPSVSLLNKDTGNRNTGLLVFETAVLNILDFYASEWNSEQMASTVDIMHKEYHWLHFAELRHFVEQANQGLFNVKYSRTKKDAEGKYAGSVEYDGKLYGKLSPQLLIKWMDEYAGQSLQIRAMMYGDKHTDTETKEVVHVTAEERLRAAEALQEFYKLADEKKIEDLREQSRKDNEHWKQKSAEREKWLQDKEKQQRTYALAMGIDYDKLKADFESGKFVPEPKSNAA